MYKKLVKDTTTNKQITSLKLSFFERETQNSVKNNSLANMKREKVTALERDQVMAATPGGAPLQFENEASTDASLCRMMMKVDNV